MIVAVKKREIFLPVRNPVSVHMIVNIQRNNQSIILQVLAAVGNTRKGEKKTSLGLSMMLIVKVHSVNCARHTERPLNEQVVYGQQGHSPTEVSLID